MLSEHTGGFDRGRGLAHLAGGGLLRASDDRPLGRQLALRLRVEPAPAFLAPLGFDRSICQPLRRRRLSFLLFANLLCVRDQPVGIGSGDRLDLRSRKPLDPAFLGTLQVDTVGERLEIARRRLPSCRTCSMKRSSGSMWVSRTGDGLSFCSSSSAMS